MHYDSVSHLFQMELKATLSATNFQECTATTFNEIVTYSFKLIIFSEQKDSRYSLSRDSNSMRYHVYYFI